MSKALGERALTETLSEGTVSEALGDRASRESLGARSMNESFGEIRVIDASIANRGGPMSACVDSSSNALETEARLRGQLARTAKSRR